MKECCLSSEIKKLTFKKIIIKIESVSNVANLQWSLVEQNLLLCARGQTRFFLRKHAKTDTAIFLLKTAACT